MTIRRGLGVIRRHGNNYIQEQADARLQEVIKPIQQKGQNALGVDSFDILLYYRSVATDSCTCKETRIYPQHSQNNLALPPNVSDERLTDSTEIVIDHFRPLFGQRGESLTEEDYTEMDEFIQDEDALVDDDGHPYKTSENTFTSGNDCGICYRIGYYPGYQLYGWVRKVLSSKSMEDSLGYHVDSVSIPHKLVKMNKREGYVSFVLEVPRYFTRVRYSIRNNFDITSDIFYTATGDPLTLTHLQQAAGTFITVYIHSEEFTHGVLEFDLGIPLKANLAQMSKALDWTRFDTLGNINLILPSTIQEISANDVVVVPFRNQVFKITDTQYLRTTRDFNLDWSVNTRVLQPQESLHYIYKQHDLL